MEANSRNQKTVSLSCQSMAKPPSWPSIIGFPGLPNLWASGQLATGSNGLQPIEVTEFDIKELIFDTIIGTWKVFVIFQNCARDRFHRRLNDCQVAAKCHENCIRTISYRRLKAICGINLAKVPVIECCRLLPYFLLSKGFYRDVEYVIMLMT